jgi:hypothetical protein
MPHSMKYLSTRGGEERLSFEEVSGLVSLRSTVPVGQGEQR